MDELNGGDGNDVLWGGEGNDTLYDSNGVDTLNGGAGDDLYWAYTSNTNIVEKANEGIDTVLAWAGGYKLGANLENLTTMVSGTFTGNELDSYETVLFDSGIRQFRGHPLRGCWQ